MSSKRLITIVTGNSNTGSACIAELFRKYAGQAHIRGAFRSEDKAKPLANKYPSLDIVTGIDASKPDTLDKAFKGAHSALIVTTFDPTQGFAGDADLTANLINSSVKNGVKNNVLISSWTAVCNNKPLAQGRFKPSEDLLAKLSREKNLNWTVLRGGYFMENLLWQVGESVKKQSFVALPKINYPMVATADIGRSAAACLASADPKAHNEKIYEISGPEYLTVKQIANVFARVLRREIKHNELSVEYVKKNMPPYVSQLFEYCFENGERSIPCTSDAKNLTGQHTSLEQFLEDKIQAFI